MRLEVTRVRSSRAGVGSTLHLLTLLEQHAAFGDIIPIVLQCCGDQLRQVCESYRVRRLELFGSATRADFDPQTSDFDFFVDFGDQPPEGSFKRYMGLKFDLEELLGRSVDLVEAVAVTNPYFLRATLIRQEVYAACVGRL